VNAPCLLGIVREEEQRPVEHVNGDDVVIRRQLDLIHLDRRGGSRIAPLALEVCGALALEAFQDRGGDLRRGPHGRRQALSG
jgi:hypothetical protein